MNLCRLDKVFLTIVAIGLVFLLVRYATAAEDQDLSEFVINGTVYSESDLANVDSDIASYIDETHVMLFTHDGQVLFDGVPIAILSLQEIRDALEKISSAMSKPQIEYVLSELVKCREVE